MQYFALLHALLLPLHTDPACSCAAPLRAFFEESSLCGVPEMVTNLPDFDTLRSMPGCCGSSYLPLKLGVGARLSDVLAVHVPSSPATPLPLTTNTSWPLVPQFGEHGRAMAAEGIEATAAACAQGRVGC